MLYFECPHCHKRYVADQKFSEANGKHVHCTGCGTAFPIVIIDSELKRERLSHQPQRNMPEPGRVEKNRWVKCAMVRRLLAKIHGLLK